MFYFSIFWNLKEVGFLNKSFSFFFFFPNRKTFEIFEDSLAFPTRISLVSLKAFHLAVYGHISLGGLQTICCRIFWGSYLKVPIFRFPPQMYWIRMSGWRAIALCWGSWAPAGLVSACFALLLTEFSLPIPWIPVGNSSLDSQKHFTNVSRNWQGHMPWDSCILWWRIQFIASNAGRVGICESLKYWSCKC